MAENNNDSVFHDGAVRGDLPKTPNPALQRLQPLIGKWHVEGPDVNGEIEYEWMEGGFFLIQRFDLVNFGTRYKGIEYSGWDEDTGTIRSRLMGTDGSRFTYTYVVDGDVLYYYFGDKGSTMFSRGTIARDGRSIEGRWTMPGAPGGGYDYRLTRIDATRGATAGRAGVDGNVRAQGRN